MSILFRLLRRRAGWSVLFWIFAFAPAPSRAQPTFNNSLIEHAELMYRWLGGTQYEVILKAFQGHFSPSSTPLTRKACYTNLCTGNSVSFQLDYINGQLPLYAGGTDTNNAVVKQEGCSPFLPNARPTYEVWYRAYVTLPAGCNDWRFSTVYEKRNPPQWPQTGVYKTNIAYGYDYSCIEAYVFQKGTSAAPVGNSSVFLTVKPGIGEGSQTLPWAAGMPHYAMALGAIDPENDSLVFEIAQPRTPLPNDSCKAQDAPFSDPSYFNLQTRPYNIGDSPIISTRFTNTYTGSPYFSFDPTTGAIESTVYTKAGRNDYLNIVIKEYRNGVLVGMTRRERSLHNLYTEIFLSPTIQIKPQTVSGATYHQNGRVIGCAGKPLSFAVDATSPAGYPLNLTLSDNSFFATPGAAFNYSFQNIDSVRGSFSWTPGPTDTGLRQLVLMVADSCRPRNAFPNYEPTTRHFFSYALPLYIAPATFILKDTTICAGDSVKLKAVGGDAFTWSVLPGGAPLSSLSCVSCKEPVARPLVTTSYVVSANNPSGCKSVDTVTIRVVPAPAFTPLADFTLCGGTSETLNLQLQAPPAGITQNVQWSPAAGLSNPASAAPLARPDSAVRYVVTLTHQDNAGSVCVRRDTVNIDVIGGVEMRTPDTAVCLGNSVAVEAIADPRRSWRWTPATALSNDTVVDPVITSTVPGTVTYTLRGTFPGCPDTVITRRISAEPNPVLSLYQKDTMLCAGDTLRLLSDVMPTWNDYRYQWSAAGNNHFSASTVPNPLLTAGNTSGHVRLTVSTPLAGCSAKDSFYLSTSAIDAITVAPADTTICPGGLVPLRASGVGITAVRWLPAATLTDTAGMVARARPQQSTRYGVVGFNRYGCRDSAWASVAVQNVSIDLPDTIFVEAGGKTQLFPIAPSPVAGGYYWSPDRWISDPQADAPYVWPVQSTLYEVVVQLASGCTAAGQVFVKVSDPAQIPVPSAFAPAAEPGGFKAARFGSYKLRRFAVYNRWGNRLFETADPTQGWDGTYNGNAQPEGTYIYLIEATASGGKPYLQKGTVLLMR